MNQVDMKKKDVFWSKKEIGKKLKKYRLEKQLTQNEVGKRLGKSQQTVGHWEQGDTYPQLDDFFRLCDLYEIDLSAVFMHRRAGDPALDAEAQMLLFYRQASADDKELISHILNKYKKKFTEELSSEIAI